MEENEVEEIEEVEEKATARPGPRSEDRGYRFEKN
jgi:hypothetical protein